MAGSRERILLHLETRGGKQAVRDLDALDDALTQVNRNVRNSNGNYKENAKGMRMMRGGAAQLGYQLQDVAVQLQNGTHLSMVFAQQGSQMASVFGPGGAALGAVIAIGGALAGVILKLDKASEATKNLSENIKKLGLDYEDLTDAQRQFLINEERIAIIAEEKTIAALQKEKDELEKTRKALSQHTDTTNAYANAAMMAYTQVTDNVEQAENYETSLNKLDSAMDTSSAVIRGHKEEIDKLNGVYQTTEESVVDYYNSILATNDAIIKGTAERVKAESKAAQERIDLEVMLYETFAGFRQREAEEQKKASEERKKLKQDEFGTFLENLNAEIEAIDARTQAEKNAAQERLDIFFDNFAEETRVMEERNARIKQLNEAALQSYGDMFGGIGDLLKEGSDAQKAAFAVNKGIAVGEAVMNLHRAISDANAQNMPWPAKLAAIAQAVATGTAAIAGVKGASFEGGGFTGMGIRSGGVDGKGGFPAILHPNETIIDHTKGQSTGGVTVNLNISAVDTSGFDKLLASRRGQIVGMINQAVNNRGRSAIA